MIIRSQSKKANTQLVIVQVFREDSPEGTSHVHKSHGVDCGF